MKPRHVLSGLFEYASSDGWSDYLQETLGEHFGVTKFEFDRKHREIVELLGEQWGLALWACAFEEFLTKEWEPTGANIADDYLNQPGSNETAAAQAYIRVLRKTIMSLYEVGEVKPGRSFVARDLLRGGAPFLVSERDATKSLKAWDRIAARIVQIGEVRFLVGELLPFSLEAADKLIDELHKTQGNRSRSAKLAIGDDTLRRLAHRFTTVWLSDVLPQVTDRETPRVNNIDGDELAFHTVIFPLVAKTPLKTVTSKLDTLANLERATNGVWIWRHGADAGRAGRIKKAKTPPRSPAMHDEIVGRIDLKDHVLLLSVNSATRAARGTAMLQSVLTDLVAEPLTEIKTMDQFRAFATGTPPSGEIPIEVATELVHATLDTQYRAVLDEPVAMLGGRTPRQAARTPAGREKLVAWLRRLEELSANQPNRADPMATYDFGWLWRELRVENLRR